MIIQNLKELAIVLKKKDLTGGLKTIRGYIMWFWKMIQHVLKSLKTIKKPKMSNSYDWEWNELPKIK